MKSKRIVFYLIVICLCVATGGAVHQTRRSLQLRARQADSLKKTNQLKCELQQAGILEKEAEQLLQTARAKNLVLQKQAEDAAEVSAQASTSSPSGAREATSAPDPFRDAELIATSPEYQKIWLAFQDTSYRLQYLRLYQQLKLQPKQIEAFEALLRATSQAKVDIAIAAHDQELSLNDPAYKKLVQPVYDELYGKIKVLLGEDGFKEYVRQSRIIGGNEAQTTNQRMINQLLHTDTPLTMEQADKLTRIVESNGPGRDGRTATDWNNILFRAAAVLQPTQLAELKSIGVEAQYDRRLQDIANRVAKAQ